VFAAYGDYIIIWEADTGTRLGEVRLPTIQDETDRFGIMSEDTTTRKWYPTKPYILAMLLHEDRLVVFAEGYREMLRPKLDHDAVLHDYLGTRVMLYDASGLDSGGNLTLINQTDINGHYSDSRVIGTNVHVVTRQNYGNMTDEEYIEQVREMAEATSIPEYVDYMTSEITVNGHLPNLACISMMQTEWNASMMDTLAYPEGLNNVYVQVASFDIGSPSLQESSTNSLNMSLTGAFLPSYSAQLYSSIDTMIIASVGYDYIPDSNKYHRYTYLVALGLDGASAATRAVGQVPGTLLNSYAVDVVDDIMRIATTVRRGRCCDPLMASDDGVDAADIHIGDVVETTADSSVASSSSLDNATASSDEATTTPHIEHIPINTSPSLTGSSTINYISMLRIPQASESSDTPGAMEIVGQIQLGKKDERFTTIRYFDNVAYAVTFYRRDPLYVLDLSDPYNPAVLSKLNMTGISDYLHPMNNDNTWLLSVGQEATEDGVVLGLQITVFDIRDPADPAIAQRYAIELNDDVSSSSEATWDFKAFQYDRQTERLILPVAIYNWSDASQDFHGFYVFTVNKDSITLTCRIQHGDYYIDTSFCYYCASFPPRAMIFNGNVTTMNSHFVRSTNPDTCESIWDFTVKIREPTGACCGWVT
jgi:Beta propeller domain